MRTRLAIFLTVLGVSLFVAACQDADEAGHPALPNPPTAAPTKETGSVTATADHITVSTNFRYRDYGSKLDCLEDHAFLKAWNPGDPCVPPTGPFEYDIWGQSYCHFKILDAAGDCMLFNSSLWGPAGPGYYNVRLVLPVGETLDPTTIALPEPSDYTTIVTLNYYQAPGFTLERGETYTIQITEQVAGCGTSRDGELVRFTAQVTVPCCLGMRGNVDGDPTDACDISDLIYLVDYMFHDGPPPPCLAEADVDGVGGVDVADLQYLVAYMFDGGPAPVACD